MTTQELIFQSPSIAIDVSKGASLSDIERAFALFFALKQLKKDVSLIGDIPQLKLIASPLRLEKEKTFAVTLRGLGKVVSKIYYERDHRDLRLYFSLQKGGFSAKDLALDTSPPSRLILIVGEISPKHNLAQNTLATKDLANSVLRMLKESERSQTQLLAHVLARAEHKREYALCFSHIEDAGFQKTQTSPKQLAQLVEELRVHGRDVLSYLLFFQEYGIGKGLLWSEDENLKKRLRSLARRQERGPWTLFTDSQKSMQELKEQVAAIL